MRNISEYPITDQEIIDQLQQLLDIELASMSIGGMTALLLTRAIERIKNNPEGPWPIVDKNS